MDQQRYGHSGLQCVIERQNSSQLVRRGEGISRRAAIVPRGAEKWRDPRGAKRNVSPRQKMFHVEHRQPGTDHDGTLFVPRGTFGTGLRIHSQIAVQMTYRGGLVFDSIAAKISCFRPCFIVPQVSELTRDLRGDPERAASTVVRVLPAHQVRFVPILALTGEHAGRPPRRDEGD